MPKVKKLGDRGAQVIENGGEPIHVGRQYGDREIPHREIPFSVSVARERVTDKLLEALHIAREDYDVGILTDAHRRALFLALYAQLGNVRLCAGAVGVTRFQVEAWRMDVENFKRDMDLAYEDCVDELEFVARQRSTVGRPWEEYTDKTNSDGTTETTVRSGVEVSDGMLMFLLRGQRNRLYGNKTELSGPDGGAIPLKEIVVRVVDPKDPQEEEGAK